MKKLVNFFLAVLVLTLGVGAFVYLKKTRPQQPPGHPQETQWQIQTQSVHLGSYQPEVNLSGQVTTEKLYIYTAPLSARVAQVRVLPGQVVKKGQLLLALKDSEVQLRRDQAKADVQDIQVQIALEQDSYSTLLERLNQEKTVLEFKRKAVERAQKLTAKSLSSQSQVEALQEAYQRQKINILSLEQSIRQHQLRMKQLNARLAKAKDQLELTRMAVQRSRIYAPADGVVVKVPVTTASLVNPGQQLVQFYAFDSLEVKVNLPKSLYELALAGGKLQGRYENKPLILDRVAPQVTQGLYQAYFRFSTPNHQVRFGQNIALKVLSPAVEKALRVPSAALYGLDRIYKVEKGHLYPVKVQWQGQLTQGGKTYTLVTSKALREGETIMVTHLTNASKGLAVKVVSHD